MMEEQLRSVTALTVFPSRANFVYVRVPEAVEGTDLRDILLTEYFRIAARPARQVEWLIDALRRGLEQLLGRERQGTAVGSCGLIPVVRR
jgi:histidinol-phosphate/aromatic aminotransferase/cobyric acid decarboxylase-like protein